MNDQNDNHWLTRPTSIRKLWWGFGAVLALTLLAQLVIPVKGYFEADGWFAFGAIYGFVSCLLMVLFAKALGKVLKRPNHYYDESNQENDREHDEEHGNDA